MEDWIWNMDYGICTIEYGIWNVECGMWNVVWTLRVIAVRKYADASSMRKVLVISGMRTESKAGL